MQGLFILLDGTRSDDKRMTREEAVSWLRQYRRNDTYKPSRQLFGWRSNYDFNRAVYERYLILELIDRIKQSSIPPIEVVRRFYYDMDDILCESENSRTWAFASTMENCAGDILRYLRGKEAERRKENDKN